MHLLHRALAEDSRLQDIVANLSGRIAKNPLKHAIVLDLNPFWLASHRLTEAGLSLDLLSYFFSGGPLGAGGGYIDLSQQFPRSADLTQTFFGNRKEPYSPYMLKIFARPTPDGQFTEQRQHLVGVARETPIATIVETQEPARLLAARGDRVISSAGVLGTLGGFLLDSISNGTFAITCGHVLSSGPASTSAGHLGQCVHAAMPKTLPAGTACTSGCGYVTELDVALIDVTGTGVTNTASSIAAIVAPGDIVTMDGATSGSRRYEVGGAVVEHTIGGSCWSKLFLFHAPVSVGVLPVGLCVAMTPPPAGGDSGAWLLRNTNEWVGMVVAGNALHGYALAGTDILAQGDSSFSTRLQLA
jgi:hypothetical protein